MLRATADKLTELIRKAEIKKRTTDIVRKTKEFTSKIYNNSKPVIKGLIEKAKKEMLPAICEFSKSTYAKIKELSVKAFDKTAEKANVLSSGAIFNISLAVTGIMLVLAIPAGNLDFGYKIVCDGEIAGVVSKKSVAEDVISEAQKKLSNIPTSVEPEEIKIILTLSNKDMIQQDKCVTNSVVACYDGRTDCYGIYADGILAAAVYSESEAKALLESYKEEYRTDKTVSLSFNKTVEVIPTRMVKEDISSSEEALEALKSPMVKTVTYKVKSGDTLSQIAENNNLSLKRIKELNPGVKEESIKEDQIINLSDSTPVVAVREVRNVTVTETVQFETDKIEDSSSYEGTTIVIENGVLGEKNVNYEVVYENGMQVEKNTLAEKITKEPVTATVRVGTKPRPKTAPTGSFMYPYSGGTLTSRYGAYRSRGIPHTGIDIAGPTGSSIYAADGGTVVFAGWNNSYGYLVKIQHADGFMTYYAHCSKLLVSQGESVYKGQQIALLGNTGNSTGPHLHFELRHNGEPVNPHNYIR